MSLCALVGEGLLAVETLRTLLAQGFRVGAVLTQDPELSGLSQQHGVPCPESRAAFKDHLKAFTCDYLFSVNNRWILPEDVLALPRRGAVNFHDAALPKYAGLFATSWALLCGESEHGVTWHLMRKEVDAGELLVQKVVPIYPDDTAHTLNTRCFEVAHEALVDLVRELRSGPLKPVPQPDISGSYFGISDRPFAAAILDWEQPAEVLERIVRALDFGNVQNEFCAAKCRIGEELFVVRRARARAGATGLASGTLHSAQASELSIVAGEGLLDLLELETLTGVPVDLAALAGRLATGVGQAVSAIPQAARKRIDKRQHSCARFERFWIARLEALSPVSSPIRGARSRERPLTFPLTRFARALREHRMLVGSTHVGLVAAFCSRVCEEGRGYVGWNGSALMPDEATCFATLVPKKLAACHESVRAHLKASSDEQQLLQERGTYARDLLGRTPSLRGRGQPHYALAITTEEPTRLLDSCEADLLVALPQNGAAPVLVSFTELEHDVLPAFDRALATFVRAALINPDVPVADLPLLSDAEIAIRAREARGPDVTLPDKHLVTLFREQVRRAPDATAVRHGEAQLSYAQLDLQSERLASALTARGVRESDRVLVNLPHGLDLAIAFLGILKAGSTYVPMDPKVPPERRASIVQQAQPRLALSQLGDSDSLDIPCVEVATLCASDAVASPPALAAEHNALAYVIFTSGSSGEPKGVEVTERGLLNHALAIAKQYSLSSKDRVLCSVSAGFDVCGEQIYPALLVGAQVVMRSSDLFDSLFLFESFVRTEQITTLILPTGFWHEWVRAMHEGTVELPQQLRVVAAGTEKVRAETLANFDQISGGRVRFFQGYGPTEATITCILYDHLGTQPPHADVPIGRPIANTRAYVMDARQRLVPRGFLGEIYVAGVGLAHGYLGQPALTEERFLPDPLVPGERMYRTGDRAYVDSAGDLVFCGRMDGQIKLRGYRVELAEIEAALAQCTGVRDCAVTLREGCANTGTLVAYFVTVKGDSAPCVEALRAQVERRLPAYMVPTAWVRLERIPRTINQKLDRRALPAPPLRAEPAAQTTRPTSALENALCATVSALCGGQETSPLADFFRDLGGDSLVALRLLAEIHRQFGCSIALSEFSHRPTVAALAERIARSERSEETGQEHVVFRKGANGALPPLWLLPAVGGHVLYGEHLCSHLSRDQAVYGIEAQGLREGETALDSIESMALRYLRIISAVQPSGPYFVCGPSLGGLVAWEVASRLERERGEKTTVALLDAWGPGYPRRLGRLKTLGDQLATIASQPSISATWQLFRDRLQLHLRTTPGLGPRYAAADNLEGEVGERIRSVIEASLRASQAYRPPRRVGDVLLFHAARKPHMSGVRFEGVDNGWGSLALTDRLRIVTVDVDHSELADRPCALVGNELQRAARLLRAASVVRPERSSSRSSEIHDFHVAGSP